MNHYDVIIIGTGAGGGTLAYALAPTGKRILLLERGPWLRREKENWDARAVFVESRYKAHESWLDKDGQEFHPGIHYYVGGNTKFYGAVLLRFRERDFGAVRHHGGISPEWPLGYQDLEPYYTKAERLYHVHGERGIDPTEPPASAPYPYPPVSNEPRIEQLAEDLRRIGHTPFPLPVGILLDEQNPSKSRCIRCDTCDGFPCLVDAKADAQVICVEPALEHPNVSMLTDAYVERLETDASGRQVTKVRVRRNGQIEEYSADVVVVSCGSINSAALLLRSANDAHPNGLANRSDVVGRHYMCHNNSGVLVVSKEPNPTKFQKTIGINDYYLRSPDWDFPLGHIQMLGKSQEPMLEGGAPKFAPHLALDFMAKHALDFWMTSEDLPDANNRVVIDRDGRLHLQYTPNNLEGHKRLFARLKGMLEDLGCDTELMSNTHYAGQGMLEHIGHKHHHIPQALYLGKKIPIGGTAHQCGTIRFGRDPKDSALDVNCKAHDVDNLYVVDGSFFVSSTAVNPSLTIIANALRVADHLRERLGANGGG